MTIILTNDDGIDAPGIAALREALADELPGVITVAPADHMSECSHHVTTQRAIRIDQRGDKRFAVHGTPADCTRVALMHLLPKLGVNLNDVWVYSGINEGGNLGADVYISGTVAAVREAAFHSLPGIAFSHYRRGRRGPEAIEWPRAVRWTRRVIETLRGRELPVGAFWNVNLPCIDDGVEPDIVFCERSRHPLPVKYDHTDAGLSYIHGMYHQRLREPGSDVDVCFGGNIAVSMIHL